MSTPLNVPRVPIVTPDPDRARRLDQEAEVHGRVFSVAPHPCALCGAQSHAQTPHPTPYGFKTKGKP